ncbi:MAG: TPM domain-containing protein [Bacteroidales bacterium]|nr:TPM domain-containing protein [Bacteroidales bacterium]
MQAVNFFDRDEKGLLRDAVRKAELNTSGEIRVHVETLFQGAVLDRAATVFSRLDMHKTRLRNGVLFYLSVNNRQFAILGDTGINKVVPDNFWNGIKALMEDHFKNEEFAQGLCKGIEMAGQQLKEHFPRQDDDINELPDDISFDKIP